MHCMQPLVSLRWMRFFVLHLRIGVDPLHRSIELLHLLSITTKVIGIKVYTRVHVFSENLGTASKIWAPEG
jgi:hypothetical protein